MGAQALLIHIPAGTFELHKAQPGGAQPLSIATPLRHVESALRGALWSQKLAMIELVGPGRMTLSMLNDAEALISELLLALELGRLELKPPSDGKPQGGGDDAVWAAYTNFQTHVGREFTVAARSHRLVPRERVESVKRERDYDVVPAAEAVSIVGNAAKAKASRATSSHLTLLLEKICDLRAPVNHDGFVLLRAPVSQAARYVAPEDVITPAKLKEMISRRLRDPRWLSQEPVGAREEVTATACIDDEVFVRVTTADFAIGTSVTFVIMDAVTRDVVTTLPGTLGEGGMENMAHARWCVPEAIESGDVIPNKTKFLVAAEALGQKNDGAELKIVPSIWEILLQFDPDDPEAADDELILFNTAHEEVERVGPGEMSKEGEDWVRVRFKKARRKRRYTLVRDHGPDEGGGVDVLFQDASPEELEAGEIEREKEPS